MPNDVTIHFSNGKIVTCPLAVQAESLLEYLDLPEAEIAAVRVNNEIRPLSTKLMMNARVEAVPLDSEDGMLIYRRSLAFLLAMAAKGLFPDRSIYIGHSLGNSYYYTFAAGKKPEAHDIAALFDAMKRIVSGDLPIELSYLSYEEALNHFSVSGQSDTALLLDQRSESRITINRCGNFCDLYIEPLLSRTGKISSFDLTPYEDGFLLRFPASGSRMKLDAASKLENTKGIFAVYSEYKKWGRIVGVHAVGELNRIISKSETKEFIRIAEAFQRRKMAEIADRIYERRDKVKAVLIAGPSSSGKTTSAKRLSIELKVLGIEPIPISLDDYYLGTAKTPLGEDGQPDYECLEALDIEYLNRQLLDLFAGKEVTLPVFDFKAGRRKEGGGRKIALDRRSILVIEGIHGLNDDLTPEIPAETKFKLYVSALTQLNLDDHNRISTSDNRLIRRIVRDNQFRAKDAAATIRMWPSVRRGEKKWIFPFQNSADAAFNSAIDYELSVLKVYAEPLLKAVKPSNREYAEAVRLLSFLENFAPVPPQYVPGTSILREFIGESEFKY